MDGAPDDGQDATGVATDRNGERVYLSIQNLRHNMETIDNCRSRHTLRRRHDGRPRLHRPAGASRGFHARESLALYLASFPPGAARVRQLTRVASPSLVARAQGAAAFLITYALISAALVVKMRLDVFGHTNMALPQFAFGEMGKYGLSFILFWTLSYALVYIY